ncbi:MAG TPA: hypothetical protein DCL95_01610 [Rhodospirillaceae bacterium]|nr:hypothetical protein [Rhodospirillaceae bacterium]MAX60972.1 hypothetical protein [Rhodospirillaceae bacterium]MAX65294.1 hypothetical protein [Rhodospirillaceae bacterium]MBB55709.1 hypothetical protein [Rhodospirillaceae bacterium]HAE00781.1 hypothetical protein [Rhodospirillaceae bacterium]|tara:strand:- start:131 stop:736 length:606 start_codon:yes stop_codon:yes gene_type:complete
MSIKYFLFDIGNVLVDWNPDHLLTKLLPDAAAIQDFRENAVTQDRILAMDRGQTWEDQLAEIASDCPRHLVTARAYRDRWVETVSGPIQGTVDIMTRLKAAGYPIYALSNFGAENFEATATVYPFLDDFDGRVVSGYEGVIKPDPAIYDLVVQRFSVDPAQTLFIDDRPENIAAAQVCGFQGHLFTDPDTLAQYLAEAGIL